jgi:O-antigen biosynthesis protein
MHSYLRKIWNIIAPASSRRKRLFLPLLRLPLNFFRRVTAISFISKNREKTSHAQAALFDSYLQWILENEPDEKELASQRRQGSKFPYRPLVSVVCPMYNPDPAVLQMMIFSILEQTYDNFELCIAGISTANPSVNVLIRTISQQDSRVKAVFLDQNRGISGNTNAAIEIADGEFIALVDQDDVLASFALYEVVKLLNQDPTLDLIYSDHDVLSWDGKQRSQPLFKPDWSPAIMLSANYVTHLTVIRKEILDTAGLFDPNMNGAQDWDLFLRVSEQTDRIAHIAKILYHWRESKGSTATNIYAKSYAPQAQLKAIQAHLARQGMQSPRAFFDQSGFIRVDWQVPVESRVSIIIPSRGSNLMLENCLNSIITKSDYMNYEIIIVNNGNKKPEEFSYYRRIERERQVRVLHYEGDFNYSAVNNFGARCASGDVLLFLNNDTEVISPDFLREIVLWTGLKDVGVVGAKLLSPDSTIQHAGVILGLTGFAGHIFGGSPEGGFSIFGLPEWYRDLTAVTAACMAIRREVFEEVGGFDEEFILCGNDVEICLRAISRGYRVVYNPYIRLKHLEGATRSGEIPFKDFCTSYKHYLPLLERGDPYYNPNLSYWQLLPALRQTGEPLPLQFVRDFLRKEEGDEKINEEC